MDDRSKWFYLLILFFMIGINTIQQQLLLLLIRENAFVNSMLMQIAELEEESDDDEPVKKKPCMWMRPRSANWYHEILLKAPDSLWIEHMRFPRREVENLAELLKDELAPSDYCVREPVPLLKRVCIALFKLASCCEYRVAAEHFGVSNATVFRCINAFCVVMTNNNHHFITFPSSDEAAAIADRLEQQHGYIQAFGALDGSHIAINPPSNGLADYLNRKMYPSLVLQGLVDDKYMFRDVSCKCPGSMHDASVYANSSLSTRVEQNMPVRDRTIDGVKIPLHILGDPAYALTTKIIKGSTVKVLNDSLSCL